MQEAPLNKQQKKDTVKEIQPVQEFLYPDYGLVILATDKQEADQKLQEILTKNHND